MKDPALVRDQALGGFWIKTRRAQLRSGVPMSISDLDWFVYDTNPDQGGKLLAHGEIRDTSSDKDADRKAGNAVVDAILQLTTERN